MARKFVPCVYSAHIQPFNIVPGNKYVLCIRVSGRAQKQRGNLLDQESFLRAKVAEGQGVVLDSVSHVGPGSDPCWVARAAAIAHDQGAILLAETTDRLIRHPAYHSKLRPNLQARQLDVEDLLFFAEGVPLMTFLHPNATPAQVRSYQRQRGQQQKGNKGGRPRNGYQKSYRQDQLSVAKTIWGTFLGRSVREISDITGRSKSTTHRWMQAMKKP